MALFFTGDLHLGDPRMNIMWRPFANTDEMTEALIARHNSLVKPDDTVINVGDVCYQQTPHFLEQVARFHGRKILIRGNHDRPIADKEFLKYFAQVIPEGDGLRWRTPAGIECFVTHYPTRGRQDCFNLVGHIHAAWKVQLNMLNVGVDVHHLYPVPAEKIDFYIKAINTHYDQDAWCAYNEINSSYCGKRGKAGSYYNGAGVAHMWELEYDNLP